jgi:hypothetical protein
LIRTLEVPRPSLRMARSRNQVDPGVASSRAGPFGMTSSVPDALVSVCVVIPQTFFLPTTMLARAHRMPTAKIAVPNTKTWGGMPTRVAP